MHEKKFSNFHRYDNNSAGKNNSEWTKELSGFFVRATLCSERGREEGVKKKKFIFTLFLLSLVALWLHHVLFPRVRESNLGELACNKLLEGQRCGEKPITLFTKTATVENQN